MPLAERTSEQVLPVSTKWKTWQLSTMSGWVGVGVVIPLVGSVEVGVEVVLAMVVRVVDDTLDDVVEVDGVVEVVEVLVVDKVEDGVGAPPMGRLGSISTQYE